jgi:membrane fusion protein
MSQDLFRKAVFDARRERQLGGISLAQPLGPWLLTGLSLLAAAAIVAFLVLGEYTRRSRVTGQLVPDLGLATIVSPTRGVVARLFPEEGDRVGKDEALTIIDVPRVMASGTDALGMIRQGLETRRESLESLGRSQADQIDAQLAGLSRQRDAARRELAQIEDEIATRREQVRVGKETSERYRKLADQAYISRIQLSQQEQAVLGLTYEQQSLERQATTLRRNLAQLEQTLLELPARRQGALATTRRDLAALELERVQQEANGELLIRAPVAGLVASRLIEPGQAVQPGQPLMSLLPAGSRLQAQLLVPSAAVGFIAPGDEVLMRYQAYPYQKFGHHRGTVIRISRSAVVATGNDAQDREPYYRVLVALDRQSILAYGNAEALRPGMRVDADILGERRKLYEWALEPLYAVRGRLAH